MKILTCNVGYLLGDRVGFDGSVASLGRLLTGDGSTERRCTDRLLDLIERERPDVACLVEVDRGSFRTPTDGQVRALQTGLRDRALSYACRADAKYASRSLVANLPFFRHLGNGVLLRGDRPTRAHYLDAGAKGLVTEVSLAADVVLFVVHLSLGTRSRTRQLRELAELVANRPSGERVIVTGDFNVLGGLGELDGFVDRTGLALRAPGDTVPSRPFDELFLATRQLDLFLCSPAIRTDRCTVLDVSLSDHRPIVMEVEL